MIANILRGEMVSKGLTIRTLANELGISRNTLSSKINGHISFNADEVKKICMILDISDPARKCEIF